MAHSQANWTTKAPFPGTARHHPITFSLLDYGYVLAGVAGAQAGVGQDSYVKDFYRYDPINDSWTKLADFPGAARGFFVCSNKQWKGICWIWNKFNQSIFK